MFFVPQSVTRLDSRGPTRYRRPGTGGMRARPDASGMELRGLRRRGGTRGALLVLHGANRADLRRASAHAALLADSCLLVAVDGGMRTCRAAGTRPDLFIGDGDSTVRVPTGIPRILYDTDKDFSDLAGALREIRRRGVEVVVLAGLVGGRLDHEWANLQELGRRSRAFAACVAPTARGNVIVTGRGFRAATVRRRHVSIFPLGGSANVTLRGTRWTLRRRTIRPGSLGLSNETGTSFDLSVHRGTVVVVFPPSPPRRGRR